jgi:hypothetical protein
MGMKDVVVGDGEAKSGKQRSDAILDVERIALGHLPHQTQLTARSTIAPLLGWLP